MKKIHIMLCLALGILVSGCFTSYVSTKQMMGIYQGMTQSQVESVLGKPDFRRFDGNMEEWEFHRDNGTPVLTSEPVTIIVQFVNREVLVWIRSKVMADLHRIRSLFLHQSVILFRSFPAIMSRSRKYV